MAQLQPMKLESRDISSISSANELFGSEKGLLVVRPGRGLAPWFCVPDGCYALVQRFGKDMDYAEGQPVWPPGYHWGPPWVQVSHLVTMQSVVFNLPVKDCKTQDNVTVTINLAICFRIKADPRKGEDPYLARNFVYKVTPRGLEQQLIDACEEATRKVARTLLHTEVYGLRTDKSGKKMKVLKGAGDAEAPPSELEGDAALRSVAGPSDDERAAHAMSKGRDVADDMRRTLNDQFHAQGVEISDVIITDVILPTTIVDQMAAKTMVISQNAAQKMNQEFEMLTLKQNEEVETLKQKNKEEREKEKQSGDMEVNEVQVQLDKMKAETKVRLAALKQESKVRVQTLNADGNLEVTKLAAEKERVLKDLHARAVSEAAQLKAETDLYEQETVSAARLTAARNEAASQELMAKAEGVAAPYVEARKQFETRQKQMKVWASLAQNKELVVSGESSDELNTILLCDAIMTDKQSEETKAQVLAEMLVMQRGSKVMLNLGGNKGESSFE